ncbi:MAG: VOC family protein [Gaiellaceae bacterium]
MDSDASGSSAVISTETVTYGEVHLDVTDCRRTLAFWHDIVGLSLIDRCDKEARLGVDGQTLVVLHHGAEQGFIRGHSGLYHLAIHLPDETEFARVLWRLIVSGYPQSPTDHTMSKSTYLNDPDGLGLELTLETPERLGSWSIEVNEPQLIDAEGRSRRIAEPLDVNEVLAHLPNRDFDQPPLPPGTKVGHLHLHVSDLEASVRFYCDLIGFREHMYAPDLGFADLSAGGRFPHRLALNTWQGESASQPPPGSAGLRRFTLVLPGEQALSGVLQRLREAGHATEPADGGELVRDPAGSAFLLTAELP